jgi:hypothetical protein
MTRALQRKQDILLITKRWWTGLQNTLGPEEPGWWYTVLDDIYFQECRKCKNRLCNDHHDAKRCPQCPAKINKRKNSGSKKNQGESQMARPGPARDRASRPRLDRNYAEPDSDDANMEEDSEDVNTEKDSEVMQQGYLCTSADPRRIEEGCDETSFSNPTNCARSLPSKKPRTIKQYG